MSVDLTIYKTGNNVDTANRASINIKNNNLNWVTLDNNYTNSVLKRINLSWPKITEEYLKAVIDYLIKNKFIGGYK